MIYKHDIFSRKDVQKMFSVSKRSSQRYMAAAKKAGVVELVKVNRRTKYRFG
jgi:transposase